MKQIQPISIWINGSFVNGTILNAFAVSVILNVSATFNYFILNDKEEALQSGSLLMTGAAYTQWQTDNYAWDWIAQQLNLTIIGDYPPVVSNNQ